MSTYRRSFRYRMEQIAWTIGSFLIAFLPTWFWLFIFKASGASGFWQTFAVIGLGTVLTGGLQFILFIVWLIFLFQVVFD